MDEKTMENGEELERENDNRAENDLKDYSEEEHNQDEETTVDIETLQEQLKSITEEKEGHYDRLLRLQAEYDNYKRRTEKTRIAERKYKSEQLANELLPVLDNFERALQTEVTEENESFKEGIEMVYNQLQAALSSNGVEPIIALNEPFDPTYHHAVMQVEDDEFEPNTVVEELQTGYMIHDKVIRPTMVKVNK